MPSQPSPREALARWLAQLHRNNIRNVETLHDAIRSDTHKPLRGLMVADDLCLMRQREFHRIQMTAQGKQSTSISLAEVAANYNLAAIQECYRDATNAWKNKTRRVKIDIIGDLQERSERNRRQLNDPNKNIIDAQRQQRNRRKPA